ncbi:DFG10 [[Candida] subhashii]|uniref:Polyprenal reductase n=1 Tax=[Candida] subhashii TaxID=561895 RepID=A0A8J5QKW7_9ASCO|nr:DFG10 [[Candida] subhashii]KAG7662318.1 DFG10 [[Candida] subhashii]
MNSYYYYSKVQLLISIAYVFFVVSIVSIKLIKPLNNLLLYGKTSTATTTTPNSSPTKKVIQYVSNRLTVPKSWFTHFYITLFSLSTVIYIQQQFNMNQDGISPNQVNYKNLSIIQKLLWIQGLRRLAECLTITNFSKTARMNFAHYFIGMAHYIMVSMSCYLGLIVTKSQQGDASPLTLADYCLIILFITSSIQQFFHHYYLSTLVKYTMPKFKLVSSPHYLNEIQIYIILFGLSVKNGWTLTSINFLTCLLFVTVNLSMSSLETYKYYQLKFKDEFTLQWAICPGLL